MEEIKAPKIEAGHFHGGACPECEHIAGARILKASLVGLIIGLAIGIFIMLPSEARAAELTGRNILQATNADRATLSLPALKPDPLLVKAAQIKADNMAKLNYFSHCRTASECPKGAKFFADVIAALSKKIIFHVMGENLATGFDTSEDTEAAFKDSPEHWRNITDQNFNSIGVGISHAGSATYVAVEFGRK